VLRDRTLFVVGAGASCEFNLPLGWQLRDQIRRVLKSPPSNERTATGAISAAISLYAKQVKIDEMYMHERRHQIAEALPLAPSIDSYIESHQHDPHKAFLGKLAIAACLLDAERSSPLFVDPRKSTPIDFESLSWIADGNGARPWLSKLFQILVEGVKLENVSTMFDNVYFVCFNYDRCIQQYLRHALARYFGLSLDDAGVIVERMHIVHPYGFLGQIGTIGTSPMLFGGDDSVLGSWGAPALIQVANRINTYSEYIEDKEIVRANRKLMAAAETTAFLGFAFHPQNVRLLHSLKPDDVRRVFATVRGISSSDQPHVRSAISNCVIAKDWPTAVDHDLFDGFCGAFFDEFRLGLSFR